MENKITFLVRLQIYKVALIYIIILGTPVTGQNFITNPGRGPLITPNTIPVSLQFMTFTAEDAFTRPARSWHIALHYAQTSIFAKSSDIIDNLPDSRARLSLTKDLLVQTAVNGVEDHGYLFDTEINHINLRIVYGFSARIALQFQLPLIGYSGGFMDEPIEHFHRSFNLFNSNREKLARDDVVILLSDRQNLQYRNMAQLGGVCIGDMAISVKSQLWHDAAAGFALAGRLGIKLPTGDPARWRGSGSTDLGLDILASKILGDFILSTNLGVIKPGKWRKFPVIELQPAYSWLVGLEYQWDSHVSLLAQNTIAASVLKGNVHPALSLTAFTWTVGGKIDIWHKTMLALGVTQNYINHENTIDFGFQVGLETSL